MTRRTCLLLLAGALWLVAALAGGRPAGAHAELASTTPADGETVAEAPASVTLEYTEAVTVAIGGVRVFDDAGDRVDRGNSRRGATSSQIVVDLEAGLGDGTYVVTWRAISADSHPIHGGFLFSVGSPSRVQGGVDALLDSGDDRSWQVVAAVLRGLSYVGLLLAAGGAAVLAWLGNERERAARRQLVTGAALLGVAAVLVALPVQAIQSTGLGIDAITESGVLEQVLGAGVGLSVLLAVVGAALVVMASRAPLNPTTRWITLAGAAVAAGSFAAAGHTRATDPGWLATGADVVHVWAAAVWFGGLVVVALALRRHRAEGDAEAAASLVARFSSLAGLALLAVAAAGGALAWGEVRTLDALTSTTYGWLLVAKITAVGVVALIAAFNRVRLVPVVAAGRASGAGWQLLRRTLGAEALGVLAILGLTGVLTGVTPARTEVGIDSVTSITAELGTGTVNLTVDPSRAGPNTIHIYLLDDVGRQLDAATDVTLAFSLPSRGLGPIERTPFRAGPGHWQYQGDVLSIPGRWRITVTSRVSEFDQEQAVADLTVNP